MYTPRLRDDFAHQFHIFVENTYSGLPPRKPVLRCFGKLRYGEGSIDRDPEEVTSLPPVTGTNGPGEPCFGVPGLGVEESGGSLTAALLVRKHIQVSLHVTHLTRK